MAEYGRRGVGHTDVAPARTSVMSRMSTIPKKRGVEDVDCVAGADDVDVAAGVNDVGRVLGGGDGALRRRRPWSKIAFLVGFY